MTWLGALVLCPVLTHVTAAEDPPSPQYDMLLKGGRVIDPKNGVDVPRDVAVWGGRVAAVAADIPAGRAARVIRVDGCYVVPGLVDIHAHVYTGTGERTIAGDLSVVPDAHAPRAGVTTIVDAGTSGRRTFPDFKDRVIDRSTTRVLAWLNVVGRGMRGRPYEQRVDDMDPDAAAATALQFPQLIVGIKTAHFDGPGWEAVDRAVAAAERARLPVMVDFGSFRAERPYQTLVLEKLRPGDLSTHMYVGLPRASVPLFGADGRLLPYLAEARRRGVLFDVGHGFESFAWEQVEPAVRQGWLPDTISTDLYARSMNAALKDMPTLLSKFLVLGVPLSEVIRMATWSPARAIRRPDLGHLDVGAGADVAVLALREGDFGLLDVRNVRRLARQRLECELTLRDGRVIFDLNGRGGDPVAPETTPSATTPIRRDGP
jgi:dihydroorotase